MLTYIIRRLLLMIPTLIGVTAVSFFVMAFSPGGIGGGEEAAGGEMDANSQQAMVTYINERYGLDEPLMVQYVRWINRVSPIGFGSGDGGKILWNEPHLLKWPDLGESLSKRRPVTDLYKEALPITLLLNILTLPVIYFTAIVIGVYMARHRGGAFDTASSVTLLGLWSIPTIWAGVMLIGTLASASMFNWFPTGGLSTSLSQDWTFLPTWNDGEFHRGWLLDRMWHLVLPVLCLSYGSLAFMSKLTRSAVLDNLAADYVRTARAKGVSKGSVLWGHAFRNSLIPLITTTAGLLPALLAGSIIVEKIFSIPGMGKLTVDAIFARDRELVLAGTLVSGVLGLISILIADLCYAIADPRVSYE